MGCDSPLTVWPKYYDKNGASAFNRSYPIPCGKCPPCKKSRVAGWRFRMIQEEKVSMCVNFITLTYDTSTVPITKNGFMTLDKPDITKKEDQRIDRKGKIKARDCHLTNFFKQLRNLQNRQKEIPKSWPKIKYYGCGEYGEEKSRPHYHAIVFNVWDYMDIGKAWRKGRVDVETNAKAGSFAYTAGYIDKEKRIPQHARDDRIREYSRISQKLGKSYVENKANVSWHLADIENRCYVLEGKKKIAMPRYYKKHIYKKWQLQKIAEKAQGVKEEKPEYSDTNMEASLKKGRYNNYYHHTNKKRS